MEEILKVKGFELNMLAEKSKRGIALLLACNVSKCIKTTERFDYRILKVTISGQPMDIIIIQVYMPTSAHDDEEIETIYDKLDEIIQSVKGMEYLVVMGDWNCSVGEGRDGDTVGYYGLGTQNKRGEKLVEFCKQKQLFVTNTWFRQNKRRRYTFKLPGDKSRLNWITSW